MTLAYALGQKTAERIQGLQVLSSVLGIDHSFVWLDCPFDLTEALQIARPALIVAFENSLGLPVPELESPLISKATQTSPIIVYSTDEHTLSELNKNRRLLAMNENWGSLEIKAYLILKAER